MRLPDTFASASRAPEIETTLLITTRCGPTRRHSQADGTSGLDTPEALEAANLYKKMIDEGLTQSSPTNYNREEVFNLFKQGNVGMIFTFPMLIPQIKAEAPDLNYKIMPFPEGKSKATYGVTDTLMLFANSDVKEAAWKFIEFAYKDEWRTKFDSAKASCLSPRALRPRSTTPRITTSPALPRPAHAKFAPTIENWEEIADTTVRTLQADLSSAGDAPKRPQGCCCEINAIAGS